MPFRGKPSKACQRCRVRRLKCDLHAGSCGQCLRAGVCCAGYRDTQELRVRNESQEIKRKALSKRCLPKTEGPRYLAISLDVQARESFFAYYVTGLSRTWNFLLPFYDQRDTPDHLKLAIEAVSLAHLSHQVYSEIALASAKERYISALHMTNKALKSSAIASNDTILLTSLLLDLFEKITNNEPRHVQSWKSHVNGALALVKLRGLDQFQDPAIIRVLVRLSTNLLISCVATATAVPKELSELRAYAEKYLNIGDPKWDLSALMMNYANLQSASRNNEISDDERICIILELDAKLESLALDMPRPWQYKTEFMEGNSEWSYANYFDVYPERHITQTWNVLRLIRILLNESILEHFLASTTPSSNVLSILNIKARISALACEICASAPQYTDCFLEARSGTVWSKATKCEKPHHDSNYQHSPFRKLDCYTLIFPLFVAAQSWGSSSTMKPWAIKQLYHISNHFDIRNAELVAKILENGRALNPWSVYAVLGGYAFAA